jgi:hypothetical protein
VTSHHHHGLEGCQWCNESHGLWGAFVLGIGVFAFGAILFLDNFGVLDAGGLAPFWPLLLVVLGLSHLAAPRSARKTAWGLSWIAVGAIMLLHNLGVTPVGIEVLWPVVPVILGAGLVLRGAQGRPARFERGGRCGSDPTV